MCVCLAEVFINRQKHAAAHSKTLAYLSNQIGHELPTPPAVKSQTVKLIRNCTGNDVLFAPLWWRCVKMQRYCWWRWAGFLSNADASLALLIWFSEPENYSSELRKTHAQTHKHTHCTNVGRPNEVCTFWAFDQAVVVAEGGG